MLCVNLLTISQSLVSFVTFNLRLLALLLYALPPYIEFFNSQTRMRVFSVVVLLNLSKFIIYLMWFYRRNSPLNVYLEENQCNKMK